MADTAIQEKPAQEGQQEFSFVGVNPVNTTPTPASAPTAPTAPTNAEADAAEPKKPAVDQIENQAPASEEPAKKKTIELPEHLPAPQVIDDKALKGSKFATDLDINFSALQEVWQAPEIDPLLKEALGKGQVKKTKSGLLFELENGHKMEWYKDLNGQGEFIGMDTRQGFDQTDAKAIVAACHARGWKAIEVHGDTQHKERMWLEAQRCGIEVVGFKPDENSAAFKAWQNEEALRNSSGAAPATPQQQTPAAPAADTVEPPKADTAEAPKANDAAAPTAEAQTPAAPEAQAPAAPEAQAPAAPEAQAPAAPEAQAPTAETAEPPKVDTAEAPAGDKPAEATTDKTDLAAPAAETPVVATPDEPATPADDTDKPAAVEATAEVPKEAAPAATEGSKFTTPGEKPAAEKPAAAAPSKFSGAGKPKAAEGGPAAAAQDGAEPTDFDGWLQQKIDKAEKPEQAESLRQVRDGLKAGSIKMDPIDQEVFKNRVDGGKFGDAFKVAEAKGATGLNAAAVEKAGAEVAVREQEVKKPPAAPKL